MHLRYNAATNLPDAMIMYGGINCYERVVVASEEVAINPLSWSNNAIEYKVSLLEFLITQL